MAEAVSVGALPRRSQSRAQVNHDKIVTAPGILSEVLDQTYEIMQTAAHMKDIVDEMGVILAVTGARAKAEKVLAPRDLIEQYWPLTRRLSSSK